jgi:hypothetical protein
MFQVKRIVGTTIGKLVLCLMGLAGIYEAKELLAGPETKEKPAQWTSSGAGSKPVSGPVVTAEFVVANAFLTNSGKLLVGDKEDYQDPEGKMVVINTKSGPCKGWDVDTVMGKKLSAKGRMSSYKGRKQLVATEAKVSE